MLPTPTDESWIHEQLALIEMLTGESMNPKANRAPIAEPPPVRLDRIPRPPDF